jgi:hypothetical protein
MAGDRAAQPLRVLRSCGIKLPRAGHQATRPLGERALKRAREDGDKAFATAMANAEARVQSVREEYEGRLRKAREMAEADASGLTAVYDKKLNSVFSTRLSANTYQARRWDYNYVNQWVAFTINPAVATTPIRTARAATPNRGRIFEDGGGFQGDLLAHYWTNDRKVEHRTLVTIDINDYYQWNPTLS